MEGRIQIVSRKHTHSGACQRVERTFIAPEYGSTSRKDAMTPFSREQCDRRSCFESRNLIPLTRDWTTCDLRERGYEGEVF